MLEALKMDGATLLGELQLYASAADYVAGQPAKMVSGGLDVALAAAGVIGFFKNDKSVDAGANVGPVVQDTADQSTLRATILVGSAFVKMSAGTRLDRTVATPWVLTPTTASTWNIGDGLFVNASGLWDNAAQGTEPRFGTVIKAPATGSGGLTDTLEAIVNTHFAK